MINQLPWPTVFGISAFALIVALQPVLEIGCLSQVVAAVFFRLKNVEEETHNLNNGEVKKKAKLSSNIEHLSSNLENGGADETSLAGRNHKHQISNLKMRREFCYR